MGEAHSVAGQPLLTHLLYTVHDPFCAARQSSFQTVFTLFSLFLGGLSLGIPDQGWGRDFMGEAHSMQVTHLLYTVQDPFSTARQSSFQNSFHTLLFVFWWTKSWHPRSRLRKRLNGWSWLQSRSAVSHPSLIHSSRAIQCSKTVQFQKQFSLSSLCFLVDKVLASQIKAEEETLWMKLTPKQVSC